MMGIGTRNSESDGGAYPSPAKSGTVPVPGQIGDRPRDGPRLSACAEQPHFKLIFNDTTPSRRQLNELMPSSIRRHHPRKEGPNLKKTQRQHSVSGAER
jgi:hypothetical protein